MVILFLLYPFLLFAAELKPFLKLETVFTGQPPLYPGQRFFVGYRYLYHGSIDLTEEKVPFLEAKGFKWIGDKQIESGEENGVAITQVVQQVAAIEPGTFPFDVSRIVGYAYTVDAQGNKVYARTSLTAEIPPFVIKVHPFPEEGKPASFRGAVGQYEFQAKLVGSDQVHVGDKIQLQLSVSGEGELEQLLSPDLCCQPGFSGYFRFSDLPPETRIEGKTKTFLIDLYVENPATTSIPPIEFSFFKPTGATYEKKVTTPIPLIVGIEPVAMPEVPVSAASNLSPASLSVETKGAFPISLPLIVILGLGILVLQVHKEGQ